MGMREGGLAEAEGLDIDYVGFSYGAPLNQAALAGSVDILLTADQPAVALMSRSDDYQIVSRMMYNRVCIYVPTDSGLQNPGDVSGKVLGGPIGAAAERVAARVLAEHQASDVRFVQLDMTAQNALLASHGPGADAWAGVDALFGFDPLPAFFAEAKLARMLSCAPVVSVVVASRDLIENRSDELERFMAAFAQSWVWYAEDPSRANAAFVAASGLDFNDKQLDLAASLEPNFKASSLAELKLTLDDGDLGKLIEARDFLANKGAVPTDFDVSERIDLGPLTAALRDLQDRDAQVNQ
ncbi:MAG: ABC transporter substrate-binding protein [Alteraurantiacibacter sp.]